MGYITPNNLLKTLPNTLPKPPKHILTYPTTPRKKIFSRLARGGCLLTGGEGFVNIMFFDGISGNCSYRSPASFQPSRTSKSLEKHCLSSYILFVITRHHEVVLTRY